MKLVRCENLTVMKSDRIWVSKREGERKDWEEILRDTQYAEHLLSVSSW